MRWLTLGWLFGLSCVACSVAPQSSTPSATLTTAPVATPIPHPPTPQATRKPRATAQPIEAGVDALKQALRQSDPRVMLPLLGNAVLLEGTTSRMLDRDAAFHWLAARWLAGAVREVTTTDYVEHFVLLEVKTTGWARVDGATSEAVTFNLHRYDVDGQGDALDGSWPPAAGGWRIDAIFFQ